MTKIELNTHKQMQQVVIKFIIAKQNCPLKMWLNLHACKQKNATI